MTEAWVLEVLSGVRDVARLGGHVRLAEQIDDAMLIAASDFHEAAFEMERWAGDDRQGAEAFRDTASAGLH